MSPQEAKQLLLLYRPGTSDAEDPEVAGALELAAKDPELKLWLQTHCATQKEIRSRLREVSPPAGLREALLRLNPKVTAEPRVKDVVIRPSPWWGNPLVMAAAALAILLLLIGGLWYRSPETKQFAYFKARMVGTVLREYRMDVATSDMREVRQYMASRGAPADYELGPGLRRLEVAGGGFLRWQNEPVSMVCMQRADKKMVYLFVLRREVLPDPPPSQPAIENLKGLKAASWSSGANSYILLTPETENLDQNFF
jgi:hypothetical protein